jgi:hypothetical protein
LECEKQHEQGVIFMKILLILAIVSFTYSPVAAKPVNYGPHVHGKLALDIAIEGQQLSIMVKSPADSIVGFEHEAKTPKDQEKMAAAKKRWTEDHKTLFMLSDSEACEDKKKEWKIKRTGPGHSEVEVEYLFHCPKPVAGQQLKIMIKKIYPKVDSINVQMIKDDGSVSDQSFKQQEFDLSL